MKNTLIVVALAATLCANAGETPALRRKKSKDFLKKENQELSESKSSSALPGFDYSNLVIKMNITQLAFRNLSFQGEFAFAPKFSVAIGYSRFLERPFFSALYSQPDLYANNFSSPVFGGYAITPEIRFYPGGDADKPAPRGFYLAPYLRYGNYYVKQTVSYQETPTSHMYSAEARHTYAGFNGGLMVGYQWLIGKHFSIDFWIAGFGYGKAKYSYTWRDPGVYMSASEQADIKKEAEDNLSSLSIIGLKGDISTTPNSVTMNVRGLPMYSIRFLGLCLGAAF